MAELVQLEVRVTAVEAADAVVEAHGVFFFFLFLFPSFIFFPGLPLSPVG